MLRKVFGRDREDTPATSVPAQTREASSTDASPSTSPDTKEAEARRAADDLVAASFDNPQVPKARSGETSETSETVNASETAQAVDAAETTEAVAAVDAAETTDAAVAAETTETAAVEAPEAEAEATTEAKAVEAPEAEAEAQAVEAPEAEAEAEAETPAATVETEATEPAAPLEAEAEADQAEPEAATETATAVDATPAAPEDAAASEAAPQEREVEPEAETPTAEAESADADADADATNPSASAAAADVAPQEQEQEAEPAAVVTADAVSPAVGEAEGVDAPEEQEDAAEPEAAANEPEADAVATDDAAVSEAAPQESEAELEVAAAAPAEPEAEVETEVAVAADAPEEQGVATAEPEAGVGEADSDGDTDADADAAPALPLAQLKAAAPHLADAYKAAGAALKKQGLTGARAAVYLVVDRSGSMRGYFKDGSVQRLAEQTVALAAHLDEDATVTTVFFSTDIDGTVELAPADLTPTRVEEINGTLGRLGRTNYHRAVEEVLAHHEKADPTRPALVVFQTDGAPESKTAATQALAEAEGRPLHWRFVAWGEEDNKAFDFVRKLDGTPRTATFFAGVTPVETAHAAFYRGLLAGLEF
ncbi:hypothetical protein AQF52_3962 [Streptomyces venezuelae]|nr:hypothetical protein AQF52_3962 [Streptomyces venezuelae]CUM40017.1 putative toxic cation resistance protein [Streptomyces venezuelae]